MCMRTAPIQVCYPYLKFSPSTDRKLPGDRAYLLIHNTARIEALFPPRFLRRMSGTAKDSGASRQASDMQVVVGSPNAPGSAVARASTGDGSIVEYGKGAVCEVGLREDDEDLEVKLRRIIDNIPVRVSNTSGSSAGSGSGDFHQYRQMRRKEQDRLTRMNVDYQKRKELAEFNARRDERLKAAEQRTARKRAKRQKKKHKRNEKKKRTYIGEVDHHQDVAWSGSEDSDDHDLDEES